MRKIAPLLFSLLIIAVALLEDFIDTVFAQNYLYYVRPFVWLTIALIGWFFVRRKFTIKQQNEKTVRIATIIILFTAIYFVFGLFLGFVYSPYSHSFVGIVRNLFSFVLILIPFEMIRCSLVSSNKSKLQNFVVAVTMIFIFLDLKDFIESFEGGLSFSYLLGTFLPCIISQVLLNYVMRHCGIKATIVWQIISTSVLYLIPILPNLNWFFNLLFVSMRSLVCYVFLYYSYANKEVVKDVRVKRRRKPYFGFVVMTFAFLLVGFVSGMFPQKPIVVVSDSMNPSFARGDIVVIDVNGEYDIGTVIQYQHDGINIIHRIVDTGVDERGEIYYVTKGDNNNTEDAWVVYEEDIVGTLSFVVPKLGFVTIWINQIFGGA